MSASANRRSGMFGAKSIAKTSASRRRTSRRLGGSFARAILPNQSGGLAKQACQLAILCAPNTPNLRVAYPTPYE